MSKPATFLCAVLFASVVNASYESDALVSAEATVALIETTIYATRDKFADLKLKAKEDVADIEGGTKAGIDSASLRVSSTLEEVRVEINKLPLTDNMNMQRSSEIADFKQSVVHLQDTGVAAIVNMSTCLDDKLAIGRRYAKNITTLSENVLANLTAIREEARHCGDNVDGIRTAAAAMECVNVAGLKAVWIETKGVPSLTIEVYKIADSLTDLTFSLMDCDFTSGFDTFLDETESILKRIRQTRRVSSWYRESLNTYFTYLYPYLK